MITLLTVGDSIRSFSENFRYKYQSIFFASSSTLAGHLALRPNEPFILILSEVTDWGLPYTNVLSYLHERGWHIQASTIVLIQGDFPEWEENLVFCPHDPDYLNEIIQQVIHTNFYLSNPAENR